MSYDAGFVHTRWMAGESLTTVSVTSPEEAFAMLSDVMWPDDREACWLMSLCTKHRLLQVELLSLGNIDHTFMAPREIFRRALMNNAAAIVLAHNHPSGDPEPSRDDVQVSSRLTKAGDLLGVDLLDHLVFGTEGRWTSMARRGQL